MTKKICPAMSPAAENSANSMRVEENNLSQCVLRIDNRLRDRVDQG